jgi:hypothetical protein
MKSIINGIYYAFKDNQTKRERELAHEIKETQCNFRAQIPYEYAELFRGFITSIQNLYNEQLCIVYNKGFRYGLLVGVEALKNDVE